jgi:hypothetical protein
MVNFHPEVAGQLCGGEKCPAAFSICKSPHRDRFGRSVCFDVWAGSHKRREGWTINIGPDIYPDMPQQSRLVPAWRLCFLADAHGSLRVASR